LPSGEGTGGPTRFSFIMSSNVNGCFGFCAKAVLAQNRTAAKSLNFIRLRDCELSCSQRKLKCLVSARVPRALPVLVIPSEVEESLIHALGRARHSG
jgi:hypothetical protein